MKHARIAIATTLSLLLAAYVAPPQAAQAADSKAPWARSPSASTSSPPSPAP